MTVCGIIAEYNPFHNGHLYHMEKSRQLSDADYIIVVLSGSFVQRGAPAFADKYMRTRMALEAGADLVIELPAIFSCASAEDFAGAGVSLLDQLGVTDYLSFGMEAESLDHLSEAARILAKEPPEFSAVLNRCLKEGLSFPKARETALKSCLSRSFGAPDPEFLQTENGLFEAEQTTERPRQTKRITDQPSQTEQISVKFSSPNNILALEYLKALYRRRSSIRPVAVPRAGADYHSQNPDDPLCSASAIRAYLTSIGNDFPDTDISGHNRSMAAHRVGNRASQKRRNETLLLIPDGMMPAHSARLLAEGWQRTCPLLPDDFSSMLAYQLLSCQNQGYTRYLDVSKDLSRRILRHALDCRSFTDQINLLKTKQYTYTRISRALCHILLQIPMDTADLCRNNGYMDYARILGFRKNSAPLLAAIKKNSSIPIVTKMADADAMLSPMGKSVLGTELFASQLYTLTQRQKFPSCPRLPSDYTVGTIII